MVANVFLELSKLVFSYFIIKIDLFQIFIGCLFDFSFMQEDELTIIDVRKFKPLHRRKFNYEVIAIVKIITSASLFYCECHFIPFKNTSKSAKVCFFVDNKELEFWILMCISLKLSSEFVQILTSKGTKFTNYDPPCSG